MTGLTNDHISEIWTALASYEPSNVRKLCRSLLISQRRRKLFIHIFLYQKTWNVHVTVALKLADWTLVTDELSKTRYFAEKFQIGKSCTGASID
ncbi:hypothetical protein P692DRAFT_20495298 [Suillus brevipes Sb2]|nr:hypothetical protein P692DRAFT_20495298 [Suillus brevipes Sb2]